MRVEIIKEPRKTMVLKVNDADNAVLKAPLRFSDKRIKEFLDSKKRWLERTALKLKQNDEFANSFELDKYIYLNGQKEGEVGDYLLHAEKMNSTQKHRTIKKYYCSLFGNLEDFASKVSEMTGLKYKEIKLLNSVRVWGSYNVNGQMKLNWKLLLLPKEIVFYVLCHELCHSKHMNHKPRFWKDVERICPNYKKLRKELDRYAFLLKASI